MEAQKLPGAQGTEHSKVATCSLSQYTHPVPATLQGQSLGVETIRNKRWTVHSKDGDSICFCPRQQERLCQEADLRCVRAGTRGAHSGACGEADLCTEDAGEKAQGCPGAEGAGAPQGCSEEAGASLQRAVEGQPAGWASPESHPELPRLSQHSCTPHHEAAAWYLWTLI